MFTRLIAFCGLFALVTLTAGASEWETSFDKAKEKAAKEGKFILMDFSGSDWCGWCIKLEKEVFSQAAFKTYAKDNLILMLVDFPRKKKLSARDTAQNNKLSGEFKVDGFPTVVLVTPEGKEVARTGYQAGGPEVYVKSLQDLLAPHQDKLQKPDAAKAGAKPAAPKAADVKPAAKTE